MKQMKQTNETMEKLNMLDEYETLRDLILEIGIDVEKFHYKGNRAASARCTTGLNEASKKAKALRLLILSKRNEF